MPRLTETQLAQRAHGMGSTDVVRALGLSPYAKAKPWDVWCEKTGAPVPRRPTTPEQDWGHAQERLILDWYASRLPQGWAEVNADCGTVMCDDPSWLMATPDALRADSGVECKNVGVWMGAEWDEWLSDGVPQHVIAQCHIGMYVTGLRMWDVVASLGGTPPKIWTLQYDENLAGLLVEGARAFWQSVCARQHPPIDGSETCKKYLRAAYPREGRDLIEADAGANALGFERYSAFVRAKEAEKKYKEIDNLLLSKLAGARGIKGDGWQFTVNDRSTRFTAKGLAEE